MTSAVTALSAPLVGERDPTASSCTAEHGWRLGSAPRLSAQGVGAGAGPFARPCWCGAAHLALGQAFVSLGRFGGDEGFLPLGSTTLLLCERSRCGRSVRGW